MLKQTALVIPIPFAISTSTPSEASKPGESHNTIESTLCLIFYSLRLIFTGVMYLVSDLAKGLEITP